jgi:hypothetical protein
VSDATLVAQEIQDLASAVSEVATAVRGQTLVEVNVPEQPIPQVTVNVPEQTAPQVTVNVPQQTPPVINVAASEVRPQIVVPKTLPSAYTVRVTQRDANGFISEFVIIPLEG